MVAKFETKLLKTEGMNSAYFIFPFDVKEYFGRHGVIRIKGTIDGIPIRSALAPMLGKERYIMVVNKELRDKIHKTAGDTVVVELELDTEPRVVELPDDFRLELERNPIARQKFEKLSYSHQKEYVDWINEAKKSETRQKRIAKTLEKLSAERDS